MKLNINFFLLLCAIYCNQYNLAKPIIGEHVRSAVENEFPFIVSIMKVSESNIIRAADHRCTGTMVSRQDVLTAAHCLQNAMTFPVKIVSGSIDLRLGTEYFPLFVLSYYHWTLHRRIDREFTSNDIGFVKILSNIPQNIPFATIGNAPNNVLYGLDVVTAGWGKIENGTIPIILQTATVKLITPQECRRRIIRYERGYVYVHERRLCTVGDPYVVLNNGDSGGPLLYFGSLIGVNTGVCPFMDSGVHPDQVNVHMSVRYYYDFISDVITRFQMNY